MAIKIQAARLLIYDALIKSEKKGKMIAKGYTADYEVERYYRDVRGWSMGGGTTQVCLNRIAHQILKE